MNKNNILLHTHTFIPLLTAEKLLSVQGGGGGGGGEAWVAIQTHSISIQLSSLQL